MDLHGKIVPFNSLWNLPMRHPFPQFHLLNLLHSYDESRLPLDVLMNQYFRSHRALGSKDKKYVAQTAYALVRWRGWLDGMCGRESSWETRLSCYTSTPPLSTPAPQLPPHQQVSCPKILWEWLVESYGEEQAKELCLINNQQAPVTLRVNGNKGTPQELMDQWDPEYPLHPCPQSPVGLTLEKRRNFFELDLFKEGWFEVQDEGSQLVAAEVTAQPGDQVLDYCAGSGGKSLAIAPGMKGKGQLFLHDVRQRALAEAKKRLKRAGVQNSQLLPSDSPQLKKLKKRMDWVLADVPCSGTGTLRRNPDMKWRYNAATLKELVGLQRNIFEKALSFMKARGKIVYATCSLLPQENEQQVEHFLQTYPIQLVHPPFKSLPTEGGMDGFFAAVFEPLSSTP